MLKIGVAIRYIQELLAHENLNTTQIYTRASIRKLQEVHEQTHPAQRRAVSYTHLTLPTKA